MALITAFKLRLQQVCLSGLGKFRRGGSFAARLSPTTVASNSRIISRLPTTETMVGLLGPPELQSFKLAFPTPPPLPQPTGEPFLDMLRADETPSSSSDEKPAAVWRMGRTENFSPTHLTSGSACLDFFFHILPTTPASMVEKRLEAAWEEDPLTALKLVFQLRGVRGTGKSDKESFYSAALWLHKHHPNTLAFNAQKIPEFGYFKDLLEILKRLHEGDLKVAWDIKPPGGDTPYIRFLARTQDRLGRSYFARTRGRLGRSPSPPRPASPATLPPRKLSFNLDWRTGISNWEGKVKKWKKNAAARKKLVEAAQAVDERIRKVREDKRLLLASVAKRKYATDVQYRVLYNVVADIFVEHMTQDLQSLKKDARPSISLAAKWCPSLDLSYDRFTLMCEAIARRMFPKDEDPVYAALTEAQYVYRVRDRLRKEVLVPLRQKLELPEIFMSAERWGDVPYNRVASVAMKRYKKLFLEKDKERFSEYIDKVKAGKAKIAGGALLPHQIVQEVMQFYHREETKELEVLEEQWKSMVNEFKLKGALSNSMAICDVSGSMCGEPMDVSVALGLLTSELSEEPWKGHLITFSARPEMHVIKGETLKEKCEFIRNMQWMYNTNFQLVFDTILERAKKFKLAPEKMVKRLFVFSDMEFDEASQNPWETDYEVICRKFVEAGYEKPPEIVFWNLRESAATPVRLDTKGVALVSGFSKNQLKMFLNNDGLINPMLIMMEAISDKSYEDLQVID